MASATLHSCIHYGYLFLWPEEVSDALLLNRFLPEPFFVACLLPDVSLDVVSLDEVQVQHIVFGITVDRDTDVEQLLSHRAQMDEMISNGVLEGFHVDVAPRFYSGIPWIPSSSDSSSDGSYSSDFSEESCPSEDSCPSEEIDEFTEDEL